MLEPVIDGLLLRQVGDSGTFAKRLDALEDKGFLSKINRETLEAALNAGHAAAHRAYKSDTANLNLVMDIVGQQFPLSGSRRQATSLASRNYLKPGTLVSCVQGVDTR